jgi:hypothetical protein
MLSSLAYCTDISLTMLPGLATPLAQVVLVPHAGVFTAKGTNVPRTTTVAAVVIVLGPAFRSALLEEVGRLGDAVADQGVVAQRV